MNKILISILVPCVVAFIIVQAQYGSPYGAQGYGGYGGGYGGGQQLPFGGYYANNLVREQQRKNQLYGGLSALFAFGLVWYFTNASKNFAG